MTQKIYERFSTLDYNLNCKICSQHSDSSGCPILPGDEVESKAGGNGPKLYHAECYDNAHQHFDYDEEKLSQYDEEVLIEIAGEFFDEIDAPEGATKDELIDFILLLELEWIQNQKG